MTQLNMNSVKYSFKPEVDKEIKPIVKHLFSDKIISDIIRFRKRVYCLSKDGYFSFVGSTRSKCLFIEELKLPEEENLEYLRMIDFYDYIIVYGFRSTLPPKNHQSKKPIYPKKHVYLVINPLEMKVVSRLDQKAFESTPHFTRRYYCPLSTLYLQCEWN